MVSTTNKKNFQLNKKERKGFTPIPLQKRCEGFTLIEIILVVFITVVISSMVIFRYHDFSDSIELENMATDVTLAIREAQVFGISSRGTTSMESFFHGYGVSFSSIPPYDLNSYISFIDSQGDNLWYDSSNEQLKKTVFKQGYSINDICATPPSLPEDCTITELNILFQRPNVNAILKTAEDSTSTNARIELISPSGNTANINISETGQVYMD